MSCAYCWGEKKNWWKFAFSVNFFSFRLYLGESKIMTFSPFCTFKCFQNWKSFWLNEKLPVIQLQKQFCFVFNLFQSSAQAIKNKKTYDFLPLLDIMSNCFYDFIFYLRMYISLYSSFTSCKYSFFHHPFEKLNVMKKMSLFAYFFHLLAPKSLWH